MTRTLWDIIYRQLVWQLREKGLKQQYFHPTCPGTSSLMTFTCIVSEMEINNIYITKPLRYMKIPLPKILYKTSYFTIICLLAWNRFSSCSWLLHEFVFKPKKQVFFLLFDLSLPIYFKASSSGWSFSQELHENAYVSYLLSVIQLIV